MGEKRISLFRQEAVDGKRDTWLGEILISRPISFGVFVALALASATIVVAFLVWGEYTKKALAFGYLVPEKGLLKIYPQQTGSVVELRVVEGQTVKKGELVAIISTERTSMQGDTQDQIAKQLLLRRKSLEEQKFKIHEIYHEQEFSAKKRLSQLMQEQSQFSRAIGSQEQRIKISENVVEKYQQLANDKFVSEIALQEKLADLIDQKSRLYDFQRNRISSEREGAALQSDLNNYPIRERNEVAVMDRSISELTATGFDNEAHRESYILAPEDGMVTALQIDRGKQASATLPIMSLLPTGTRLQADLYVPSRAVGFIRKGLVAQIQYQAFPYQKFGSHQGVVVKISRTAVPATELPFPAPANDVYYVVTVRPDEDYVLAYGQREALQAGMQVDADLWLDRRTLLEWILEPLYSVSGRM